MREPKRIQPQNVVDGDHVLRGGKDDIIERILTTCSSKAAKLHRPMWMIVQVMTMYGSTYSQQLCRAYGFNPEYSG